MPITDFPTRPASDYAGTKYDTSGMNVNNLSDEQANSILSGLNGMYSNLAKSNPYRNYNYTNSWWDDLGDALNFHTRQDDLRLEMEQAERNYDAQIAQLQFENQYNSDVEKSSRMRQAGLNPDLLGTQGVSESSAFDMPQREPELGNSGMNQTPLTFLQGMFNAVGVAFDLAQKMIGVEGGLINLDKGDMSLTSDAFNIASLIKESMSTFGYDSNLFASSGSDNVGFSSDNGKDEVTVFSGIPVNRSNSKRVAAAFNKVYHSLGNIADINRKQNSIQKDKTERVIREMSGFGVNDYSSDGDRTLKAILEPCTDLFMKYYLEPYKSAKERGNEAEFQTELRSALRSVVKNLSGEDDIFSQCALLVIMALSKQMF